mgnify:CR=1 FL=1|tara:strand:- start:854 stop:1042 length:189 start_codon:yes stop_codon:yes gene_type:complete
MINTKFIYKKAKTTKVTKEIVLQLSGGEFNPWYKGLNNKEQEEYAKIFKELQETYDSNKSMG